jgi:mRNA interferase HigB
VTLIGRDRLLQFVERHPDAQSPLEAWARNITCNHFRHFAGLRQVFRSADHVRPFTVFNIGGNKYRLIAVVDYGLQVASVQAVLTHTEYDKETWR